VTRRSRARRAIDNSAQPRRQLPLTRFSNIAALFPPRTLAKLHFSLNVAITTSATVNVTSPDTIYALNSLFDPAQAVSSHQPYGFDQLATFYRQYKVFRVHVKVSFPPDATAQQTIVYVIGAAPSANTYTYAALDFATLSEIPLTWIVFSREDATVVWRRTFDIGKLEGLRPNEFNTALTSYAAAVANDPVKMPSLHILAANPQASAAVSARFFVEFEFEAEFFDPITQTPS